jgi:hypothetical protein
MRRATAVAVLFSTAFFSLPNVRSSEPSSSCPQNSSCPYPHGRAPAAWYVGAGRIRPATNPQAPTKPEPTIVQAKAPAIADPVPAAATVRTVALTATSETHTSACPEKDCSGAACDQAEEFTAAQLMHLTKAAEHLAAGGFEVEAQELMTRVDSLRQKQIEQTTAEIERLQAKLVVLRGGTKPHSSPITTANRPEAADEPQR